MKRADFFALCVGLALMSVDQFRPWEPANPAAVFTLGLGMSIAPMIKEFFAALAAVRQALSHPKGTET